MIFNKKGQDPSSIIIWTIVIAIAAVIVVLFFTDFGKKLVGLGQATPSALEAATQGCINAANNNLVTDYCYNFRKVGNEMYVNCQDARIQSSITQQGITHSIACVDTLRASEISAICEDMTVGQKKDATFNGNIICSSAEFVGPPAPVAPAG